MGVHLKRFCVAAKTKHGKRPTCGFGCLVGCIICTVLGEEEKHRKIGNDNIVHLNIVVVDLKIQRAYTDCI